MTPRRYLWLAATFLFAGLLLSSCKSSPNEAKGVLAFAPDNDSLQVPSGFRVIVVAKNIGAARHIAIRDNGDIYIALNSPHQGGSMVALRDTNRDGKADVIRYFGDMGGGTGIGIHDGYLYFGSDTAIVRYKLRKDSLLPDPHAELIARLPVQHEHQARSIAFDGKGNLYVNIGAPSNCCQVQDRTKGSPGQNPCPLLEYHAGIWRFDASKQGQTQQQGGTRYVTGIRNCVALAWNPNVNDLYAVMHGRDQLHQFYPQYYDEKQGAELPAEEFLRFKEGANYGWPYVYYDEFQKKLMINPEYGGDGKKEAPAGKYQDPILAFPGHWAPDGLLFYTGSQFPDSYHDGAFIAFHGSWNRAPLPQRGYDVIFVPFKGDSPSGKYSVFAGGFTAGNMASPGDARYRPCGLGQGPDGSLYLTDDAHGTVFRFVYTGGKP